MDMTFFKSIFLYEHVNETKQWLDNISKGKLKGKLQTVTDDWNLQPDAVPLLLVRHIATYHRIYLKYFILNSKLYLANYLSLGSEIIG